ncbi:HAD family hydrolase [Haloarchaeobius sp. DFWS5]|uniref:HAD family hydrolase n=1 Tax=Haloarchaeobius sp. DFWS5 TaxID=3446114 RepID=UPI003EB8551C
MTAYETVLFDNDGVLVDPPAAETQAGAIRAAFAEVGVEDPTDQHVDALASGVTVDALTEISSHHGLDPGTLWSTRERLDEQSQFAAFRAGERDRYDDVSAIFDLPQPCGVVSNNHHSTIEFVLDFFDLDDAFETYYGREMTVESIDRKKPNTHYLDRAHEALGGGSALYVGDSESDVVAAQRAGMDSVFVRRSHNRDVSMSVTPTYEIETLDEIADVVTE